MPNEEKENATADVSGSVLSELLTPGSTRKPEWIAALNLAFASLFGVFLGLLWMTGGNKHIWALMGIEGCLWGSVKWFIYELERTPLPSSDPRNQTKHLASTEDKKTQ